MGGVSEGKFQIDPSGSEKSGPTGVFKGLGPFFYSLLPILQLASIELGLVWSFFQVPFRLQIMVDFVASEQK